MLKDILKNCGINESEQVVFELLLANGISPASTIARRSNIKRPTVYAALNKLIDLGLVTKIHKQSATYYSLLNSDLIIENLKIREASQYNKKKNSILELEEYLESKSQMMTNVFFEFEISTIDNVSSVYLELSKTFKKNQEIKAIFNPQIVINDSKSKEIIKEFLDVSKKNNAIIKEIVVDGPMVKWYKHQIDNPNHLLKIISPQRKIITDTIITNDYIYFLKYDDTEGSGVKIKRKDLLITFNEIFDILWEQKA